MKQIIPALAVLFLTCCKTDKSKQAELLSNQEVNDFINIYDKAWHDRDTMKMKNLMAENYIYFTSVGSTIGRANILEWFKPEANYKVDAAYRDEIVVTINGNTAIVNSHWVGNGNFGDEKFEDDQRCGLVVQKVNGTIKIISEHCVQIEKKGG